MGFVQDCARSSFIQGGLIDISQISYIAANIKKKIKNALHIQQRSKVDFTNRDRKTLETTT